jgi:hypothetical protein
MKKYSDTQRLNWVLDSGNTVYEWHHGFWHAFNHDEHSDDIQVTRRARKNPRAAIDQAIAALEAKKKK